MMDGKSSRTIESKMRQKTKSVHRARGKLILYSTATKPIAVCPRSNHRKNANFKIDGGRVHTGAED